MYGPMFQRIAEKYDDVASVDKIAAVAKKVETVKLVMQENVDIALQNCVKLESIEKAAGSVKLGIVPCSEYHCNDYAIYRGTTTTSWCLQEECQ